MLVAALATEQEPENGGAGPQSAGIDAIAGVSRTGSAFCRCVPMQTWRANHTKLVLVVPNESCPVDWQRTVPTTTPVSVAEVEPQ